MHLPSTDKLITKLRVFIKSSLAKTWHLYFFYSSKSLDKHHYSKTTLIFLCLFFEEEKENQNLIVYLANLLIVYYNMLHKRIRSLRIIKKKFKWLFENNTTTKKNHEWHLLYDIYYLFKQRNKKKMAWERKTLKSE
jgi:hypothetical protein